MKQYGKNGRYLEFRGKPVVAVGSGEHYGAVLNTDFDYLPYLDALARDGLNQCRIFSGTYREMPGDFGIEYNNLAPREEAYLCPWKRVGPQKWDLTGWDEAYWRRLKDFCAKAMARGVLVEYVLFCFWYNDRSWSVSPMNPGNTVQQAGPHDRARVYDIAEKELLGYQAAFVRKSLTELAAFDNVYIEICNEPYSHKDGTMTEMDEAWHRHLAAAVKQQDSKRLIAVNYRNRYARLEDIDPSVSICNFHYAEPRAARDNYSLGLVLADDETGFAGQTPSPYRREAWRFLLAGGCIFSHLDYSFTLEHPDGTAVITGKTPGYGGTDLRRQLGFLRRFLQEVKVWDLRPLNDVVIDDSGGASTVMGDPGRCWIGYVEAEPAQEHLLRLRLSNGSFTLKWLDPVACRQFGPEQTIRGGERDVSVPTGHSGELAFLILRRDESRQGT